MSDYEGEESIIGKFICEYEEANTREKPLVLDSWITKYPSLADRFRNETIFAIFLSEYGEANEQDKPGILANWIAQYSSLKNRFSDEADNDSYFQVLFDPVARLPPPPQIPGYEILETIGRGGMGNVYRAKQLRPSREVAIKVIRPDFLRRLSAKSREDAINRFRYEAAAAARLENDNIVTIYEVGEVDDKPFYSMRLVKGDSLGRMIANGDLTPLMAASYMRQVATAIHAAFDAGILHRDIRPLNVLVTDDGVVKIIDFGFGKKITSTKDFDKSTFAALLGERVSGRKQR